jgi:hypothetical protein
LVVDGSKFADPSGSSPGSADQLAEDYRLALSPIERAFGLPDDVFQISEILKAHSREKADGVTACMSSLGFDGFVDVPEVSPEPADLADFSSTEAVASFGYGPAITLRSMLDQLTGTTDLLETDPNLVPADERNWENFDPIVAYLETNPQVDEEDFAANYGRCHDQVAADQPAPQVEAPRVVAEEIYEVRTSAASTPAAVAAWDAWSRCLAEDGYRFITRVSIRTDMESRGEPMRGEIVKILQSGSDVDDGDLEDLEQRIEDLAELERAIAQSDVACAQSTDLDDTLRAERDRVEQAWLDGNEDRIRLLLAEAEAEDGAGAGPANGEAVDQRPTPADG